MTEPRGRISVLMPDYSKITVELPAVIIGNDWGRWTTPAESVEILMALAKWNMYDPCWYKAGEFVPEPQFTELDLEMLAALHIAV